MMYSKLAKPFTQTGNIVPLIFASMHTIHVLGMQSQQEGEQPGEKTFDEKHTNKLIMGTTIPAAIFGGMFVHTISTGEEHLRNSLATRFTKGCHIIEKLDSEMQIKDFLNAKMDDGHLYYDDVEGVGNKAYKQAFHDTAAGDDAALRPEFQWLEELLKEAVDKDPDMTIGSFRNDPFGEYGLRKGKLYEEQEWADTVKQVKELKELDADILEAQGNGDLGTVAELQAEKITLLEDLNFDLPPDTDFNEYADLVLNIDKNGAAEFDAAGLDRQIAECSVDITICFLALTVITIMFLLYWQLLWRGGKNPRNTICGGLLFVTTLTGLGLACKGVADMKIVGSFVEDGYNKDTLDTVIEWGSDGRFNSTFLVGMMLLVVTICMGIYWKAEQKGENNDPFSWWPVVYGVMAVSTTFSSVCFADAVAQIESGSDVSGSGFGFILLTAIACVSFFLVLFKKELKAEQAELQLAHPIWMGTLAFFGGLSLGSIVFYMDQWYIGTMGFLIALTFMLSFKCSRNNGAGADVELPLGRPINM